MSAIFSKPVVPRLFFLFIIVLGGCDTTSPDKSDQIPITHSKEVHKVSSSNKECYQLLSKHQPLIGDNINNAQRLIHKISAQKLDTVIPQQSQILTARLLLESDQPHQAVKKLEQVGNIDGLTDPVKMIYYANTTCAYLRTGQIKKSIIAEIALNDLLNSPLLARDIWYQLHTFPLMTLHKFKSQARSKSERGWLDLIILSKQQANQPKGLIHSIQEWQKQYTNHTANQLLPRNSDLLTKVQNVPPAHIALLLPLQGRFGKMGLAVRDGFMTAFYEDSKRLSIVPSVKVYDTSRTKDIVKLYHQAVQEGAQFVIGPLTKPEVKRLSKIHLEVPTLALNHLSKKRRTPKHFIQFGLSSEQAAEQAAIRMWQKGMSRILLITPQNEWGKHVKQSFLRRWQMQGGTIVYALSFENKEELVTQIPVMLDIDQSIQRIKKLEDLFGKKLRSIPRRRQDFDGIFFAGTSAQAKQIRPLLKFYYAGNVPTFSIFSISSSDYASLEDSWDFEDIYFNDIPWLLVKDHTIDILKQRVQLLWPAEYKLQGRLFALGIDSYLLSILLPRLIMLPDFPINGVTGQLYLTTDSRIHQQLLWARFGKKGIPKLLT